MGSPATAIGLGGASVAGVVAQVNFTKEIRSAGRPRYDKSGIVEKIVEN